MKALVLNCGSSSIKFKLFDGDRALAAGAVSHVGEASGTLTLAVGDERHHATIEVKDHHAGLALVEAALAERVLGDARLGVVGHRVVHGGERFSRPTVVDDAVLDGIRAMVPLAPLHNPANVEGIEVARARFPNTPSVAVFDTAFHQSMPPAAYRYALPERLYAEHGVRRYGFHGTSHHYVSERLAGLMRRPATELKAISLHLGNGASACAVRGGQSVDTSMGMTPLEGLVMGTRSGDLDPAIPDFLARETDVAPAEIDRILNRQSGLLGLCGDSDMRAVEARVEAGDPRARLAFDVMVHRLRKYVGAYHAVLEGADALLFTGGVGENDARLRAAVLSGLEGLGFSLDAERNQVDGPAERRISADGTPVEVWVVPTDEELAICRQAVAAVRAT